MHWKHKSVETTLLKSAVSILLKSVVGASAYAALWNSYTFEKCSANYAFQKYSFYTFVFSSGAAAITSMALSSRSLLLWDCGIVT